MVQDAQQNATSQNALPTTSDDRGPDMLMDQKIARTNDANIAGMTI